MITDALINFGLGLLNSMLSILPDMPAKPPALETGWKDYVLPWNYLFPISEFVDFIPVLLGVYTGFLVWRIIRFIRGSG